jgi:hypothetical protein
LRAGGAARTRDFRRILILSARSAGSRRIPLFGRGCRRSIFRDWRVCVFCFFGAVAGTDSGGGKAGKRSRLKGRDIEASASQADCESPTTFSADNDRWPPRPLTCFLPSFPLRAIAGVCSLLSAILKRSIPFFGVMRCVQARISP